MSLGASKSLLNEANRELFAQWEEVRQSWRDAKAAEFDKDYLAELPQAVATATRIIEEIDLLLSKIHADCD
ncbi:hypothetical protein [Luteolibacter marinus]|uniref:hypothetical protein n=1 Tax=Luteolibacter marinus TaxID=2776705 RepID=UPI0018691809|nr:hypothetical protein [Luteolibacter marinus]